MSSSTTRRGWLVPAGLLLLSFGPVLAGSVRVTQLAVGVEVTPANERFFAMPLPVVVHIFSATTFAMLGAFQFSTPRRRRRPRWHRIAGRIVVPCGLAVAVSGLWMTLYYPHQPNDGSLLTGSRLVFGSAMAASIVVGFVAIRRREFARHQAWMIRGYAIGLASGTEFFTVLPYFLLVGQPGEFPRAMLTIASSVINVAVAEWIIRRRPVAGSPARRGEFPRSVGVSGP